MQGIDRAAVHGNQSKGLALEPFAEFLPIDFSPFGVVDPDPIDREDGHNFVILFLICRDEVLPPTLQSHFFCHRPVSNDILTYR